MVKTQKKTSKAGDRAQPNQAETHAPFVGSGGGEKTVQLSQKGFRLGRGAVQMRACFLATV